MENNIKIIEKLRKIKTLAEQGVGGEKEGAIQLYNKLLAKYELTESEIIREKVTKRWVRFENYVDQRLIIQLFYKVTGDRTYYTKVDKRKNMVGFECTDFELSEFLFYYNFYKEHLKNELDVFLSAFMNVNHLFPDDNVRVYDDEDDEDTRTLEEIERDLEKLEKMRGMAQGMNSKSPHIAIESKE